MARGLVTVASATPTRGHTALATLPGTIMKPTAHQRGSNHARGMQWFMSSWAALARLNGQPVDDYGRGILREARRGRCHAHCAARQGKEVNLSTQDQRQSRQRIRVSVCLASPDQPFRPVRRAAPQRRFPAITVVLVFELRRFRVPFPMGTVSRPKPVAAGA